MPLPIRIATDDRAIVLAEVWFAPARKVNVANCAGGAIAGEVDHLQIATI
jgi:hypothetical protein